MRCKIVIWCLVIIFIFSFCRALFALAPYKRITQYDMRIYKAKDGRPMNSVKKIFQDSKGYIWIGTQEGLVRFDGVRFKIYRKVDFPALKSNFSWDIAEDFVGRLWLTTQGGGVSCFEGTVLTTYDTAQGLAHTVANHVFITEDGSLSLSAENVWSRFADGRFVTHRFEEGFSAIINDNQSLCQNRAGQLYFLRYHAALTVIPWPNVFTTSDSPYGFSPGLLHLSPLQDDLCTIAGGTNVCSSCPLRSGEIPAGTSGGVLYRIHQNPDLEIERLWQPEPGRERVCLGSIIVELCRDGITALYRDQQCGLRIGSDNYGLYHYIDGIYSHYAASDGLSNDRSFVILEDDSLNYWFSCNTDVFKIASSAFSDTDQDRDLVISYTALNFASPERERFRIRLDGYDKERRITETHGEAAYTNLPKETCAFTVITCDDDGVWNSEGATQWFIIPSSWYETRWACATYIGLGCFALFWTMRRRYRHAVLEAELNLQKEHTAKLEELNQNKSRFFAGISHEFRTPLTLIRGPLEELLDKSRPGAERTALALMYNNTLRLEHLVQELLDLAHLQSNSLTLNMQSVDLVAFIVSITASFESLAKQRRIRLSFLHAQRNPAEKKLVVQIDPEKMEKVLVNLIFNAIKYTAEKGCITVVLESDYAVDQILIKVRDTGRGIPQDVLPRIFDLFFHWQQHHARFEPGAGIGLALSKELVKLHDGELSATSVEGKGSEFVIHMPFNKDRQKDKENNILEQTLVVQGQNRSHTVWYDSAISNGAKDHKQVKKNAAQILLIEDHPEMRYYIRRHLRRQYILIEAKDGVQGLSLAATKMPDLILSDIMMPNLDGLELVKKIKENELTNHIPIILISAKSSPESRLSGLESGATEYIIKPFEMKELQIRIKNLLDLSDNMRRHCRKFLCSLDPPAKNSMDISWDDRFLHKTRLLISEHMDDPEFGPDKLARLMAVSRSHLNRKLSAIMGLHTNEFIRIMRLNRAAELLQAGTGSVSEIAFQVGFEHLSYFARSFKKQFGVIPSRYRRKIKSGR